MRQKRKENVDDVMPSEVCYCDGKRELGTMELHCNGCKKWFHQRCLRDLKEFYGLPFMVCYVFLCQDCANDKHESWTAKQTNFSHMCIMALANMVVNHFKEKSPEVNAVDLPDVIMKAEPKFFRLDTEIIPFFDENWESLTPLARRVKTTWHGTIAKTLAKETELFVGNDGDENLYTLKERDLTTIGPFHKAVRNLGKRAPSSAPTAVLDPTDEDSGPKTRGASKRKQVENVLTSVPKRYRTTGNTEPSPLNEGVNQNVDAPFNRGEIRYYLAEEDPCVTDKNQTAGNADDGAVRMLVPHHYRIVNPPVVMISPNDRAHQLKLDADGLTLTGNGGYAMARATHSVSYGRWFYEIEFLSQPGDSHIRVGWARSHSVAQACVGYSKFSYGWRSLKGTAFHDGCGLTYSLPGFKQGDTLGCLIDLPDWEEQIENDRQIGTMLPKSHKKNQVIKFKNNFFFEEHDDVSGAVTRLKEVPGSKIEFFLNGRSQGAAFNDIYEGFYFPAVSIFHDATIRCNFGPKFRYPLPKKSMPMSARPEQVIVEQTLSDICDLVSINEDQQKLNPLLTAKEEPMEH
ncbi:Set1/Ash2 histone methyltransferase complex subunit ASH2 [Aphelenchoides besseyi]|nr:Set1/Ash2 histone methyltransferase complex subunit ASH2 [Aphelenchoides besseyi]KAI6193214.1 Set1/Ash2 histone methyltransferase complex subunit ASH2 [Aphelenchoides besseyi]